MLQIILISTVVELFEIMACDSNADTHRLMLYVNHGCGFCVPVLLISSLKAESYIDINYPGLIPYAAKRSSCRDLPTIVASSGDLCGDPAGAAGGSLSRGSGRPEHREGVRTTLP